jgi:Tol biopolymer transport system component
MRFQALFLVCGTVAVVLAQSGNDLFQKGLAKERADGNLRGAIQIYQQVASMPGADRKLAAEALFRIAECQQALGNAEARKTYQRIVHDFSDQREVAGRANDRLAALGSAHRGNSTELATRRVWVPPSYNLAAGRISPDGRYFSYAEFFTTGDLAVRDLVTGATRHVTHKPKADAFEHASNSLIAPDQSRIAYIWKAATRSELRVIDWDGSNERIVYANPQAEYAIPDAWSSDGREILATIATRDRTKQLAWTPLAGGTPRVVKTFPWQVLRDNGVQALSPDGGYIAYDAASGDRNRTIFILSRDGKSEEAVTDGLSVDEVFGWMPDGKSLLFATNRTGARELWALPVWSGRKNGEPYVVKPDLGEIEPLGISKDGDLFYRRYITQGQAYTAGIDWRAGKLSSPVPIAHGVIPELGADWSPDGKEIAYVAHRGAEIPKRFVVVHSLETGQDREIQPKQELGIFVTGGYRFSPDGKSFMVTGADAKQRHGAYSIDLTTGDVHALIQRPEGNVVTPEWLPGGKEIIYILREASPLKNRVFIRNLETGTDRELPLGMEPPPALTMALSPDGKQVAFSPLDHSQNDRFHTLYVMPVSGGAPRKVLQAVPDEHLWLDSWTPDAQRLLFSVSTQNPKEWTTWWISPTGGERHSIEGWVLDRPMGRFNPDGTRVTFIKGSLQAEFWMLENLGAALHSTR